MSQSVAAIVPARDEAARIGATVRALRTIPAVGEVIVADGGSMDSTAAEARAAGARVCRAGRGKGAALQAGLRETDARVLLFIDADLGETAAGARVLLDPVLSDEADLTIGCPPADGGPSGFGLVERLARIGVERLCGRRTARPLSGQRAVRREVLDAVGPLASGFGVEVGLTIDAVRAGFRVVEIPYAFEHARTGRDFQGFAHRSRQGFDMARVLAARVGRDRPDARRKGVR